MQYLVRLVTPNGGTVLDPFNGSGSTGKAVMYENKERNKNYRYIGIELTEEYLPIAKARIEYVCNLTEKEKKNDKQLSIFDMETKKQSKLKILELFGGIGACSKALEKLGIDYEIADYVEIDKFAVKSFNAIHDTNFEPQDICTWDKDMQVDLIMHGSPCQDFSIAGLQAGGDENSGTRSSLMYETVRIVEKLKPKYVIWENVKNILSKKHRQNFDNYLNKMSDLGYTNFYEVLNAKDYGIPQNRERVFTVSILENENFEFPPKQELKLRLKDMLENEVDEKYYLSDKFIQGLLKHNEKHKEKGTGFIWKPKTENDIANCLRANGSLAPTDNTLKETKCKVDRIGGIFDTEKSKHQAGSVYDKDGLSPTLDTMQGGWRQPCIENKDLRIRKLTPKECWRLMGFDDADFEKAEKVNSNTQLYKQAGNSIVVNVLEKILKNLLIKN